MDIRVWLLKKIYIIPAILIAFTIHSFAQALVADRLGDKGPRSKGRLTLNPLVHIDLIGFIMILIFSFGFGKPMETNPRAYKNYYKDDLKVRVSGIVANLLTAVLFTVLLGIVNKVFLEYFASSTIIAEIGDILITIFFYVVGINCMFAIINIIPIPGLSGFYIMRDLNPKFFYSVEASLYKYQFMILIIFIMPIGGFSVANILVGMPGQALANFLINLVS